MKKYTNKLTFSSSPLSKNQERISYNLNGNKIQKTSILNIHNESNKNKMLIPKKKVSQISSYKISMNELNEESNYISTYLRKNLNIPPRKKSQKIDLEKIVNKKKVQSTIILNRNKKEDFKLSPNITLNLKKNPYNSKEKNKKFQYIKFFLFIKSIRKNNRFNEKFKKRK